MDSRVSHSRDELPAQSTTIAPQITTEKERVSGTRDVEKTPSIPHVPSDLGYEDRDNTLGQASEIHEESSTAPGPIWNHSHPCYPHPNPHVPLSSSIFKTTRVIRVPRNWMAAGDLYPAFSNVYPEILEPWIREVDFRRLIEGINTRLAHAFNPTGTRAWADGIMGCLTGWIWEDLGLSKAKGGMRDIERFIDVWNREREGDSKAEDSEVVQCIQLRRTGFLCLDIVIPDPKVIVVNEPQTKEPQNSGNGHPTTPASRLLET